MTASFTSTAFALDALVAGNSHLLIGRSITLISGQNLTRGAVLGKIATGAASSVAGTNTGNGVMGAITVGALAQAGAYILRVTAAAVNAGSFQVTDPQGDVVGIGTVAQAFSGGGLSFTLADGAVDFAVGDTFTITVAAGSGKYTLSLSAAADGSQAPDLILAENTDASGGDKTTLAYARGDFIESKLTIGTAHTADSIREGLRGKGINLIKQTA